MEEIVFPWWEDEEEPKAKRSRSEVFNDYEGFVEKFKPKKTTDDCYTPPEVYEVLRRFVDRELLPLDGVRILRPFWPGKDYRTEDYSGNCLVLDNPPFSISSEILRFYQERGVRYFLFGNALTALSSSSSSSSVILTGRGITYANGANVNTCFFTNLLDDVRVWCCPKLGEEIEEAQKVQKSSRPVLRWPLNLTSAALLGKIAKRVDYKIYFKTSRRVSKACGKRIFGGGLLLSQAQAQAQAQALALAQAQAQAQDRDSEEIVKELSENDREIYGNDKTSED